VQKIERLKGEQETLLPSIELHDAAKALLQRAIKQRSKSKETASLVRSLRLCCTDIEKKKKEGQDLWAKLRMLKIDREILIQDHKQDFCDQCGAHRKYWREVE
jgi:molybdenum cofactor biosynthesis enzyme MoaA